MRNTRFNSEGYYDPTAHNALQSVTREEDEIQNRLNKLITVIKLIIDLAGFDLIGRIKVKHRKSGKDLDDG